MSATTHLRAHEGLSGSGKNSLLGIAITVFLGAAVLALLLESRYTPLVLATGSVPFIFVALRAAPHALVSISVIGLLLASTEVLSEGSETSLGSVFARAVAAGVLFIMAVRPLDKRTRRLPGRVHTAAMGFAVLIWMSVAVPSVIHGGSITLLLTSVLGLATLISLVQALHRQCGEVDVKAVVLVGLLAFLTVSLMVALVGVPGAIVQGRLAGISPNANMIGFLALLSISLAVTTRTSTKLFWLTMLVSIGCLVWSGSRTSALAAAVVLLLAAGLRLPRSLIVVYVVAVGFLSWVLLNGSMPSLLTSQSGILRENASRSDSWRVAIAAAQSSPLIGLGPEGLPSEVASSPLRVLAVGGIPTLAMLLVALCLLLISAAVAGRRSVIFTLGALVHSTAEAWLVSTTGAMIIIFLMAWVAVVREETNKEPAAVKT